MMRPLYRRLLVAVTLCAAAIGIAAYATDALRRADLATVDARFDVRGERPAPRDVVLIKLDERSFTDLQADFPLPRDLYARAIERLDRAGAKVIAVDVQFTEESGDVEADNALVEAVRRAGNVVLGTAEIGDRGETNIFGGGEGLEYSRATPAHILVPNDPGAVIRRMSLSERGLDAFGVATAERLRGRPIATPGGTPWIDFTGPPGHVRAISFSDVVRGRFRAEQVRGRVAVIGATALALQDRQPTSTSDAEDMPGPEIQVNAIDTVLRGFPLETGPGWLDVVLIVLAALVAPAVARRFGILRALGAAALTGAAIAVGAQLAFDAGTIVSVVYAALALALSALATLVLHGLTVAFEREQVRATFARFVPEAVVGEVLSSADGARLGGVRRECTLLFSDLRGFTSFSERREPDVVIDVLNRYLTEMSDAILDHGGTLAAFMGDGIMAIFGAPLPQDDHADRAVDAAVAMLARMDGFNAWLREQDHGDGFKMGIGLNTGPAMSGNVGSERRLEYTAIGDVTNTASRIEALTKGTPHQLFLSEATRQALTREHALVPVGEFPIRGRTAPITLWTVAGVTRYDATSSTAPAPAPPPAEPAPPAR